MHDYACVYLAFYFKRIRNGYRNKYDLLTQSACISDIVPVES